MAKIGNHAVVEGYAGLTQIAHSPEPAQTKNEPNAGPNAIGASGLRWSVQRHAPIGGATIDSKLILKRT